MYMCMCMYMCMYMHMYMSLSPLRSPPTTQLSPGTYLRVGTSVVRHPGQPWLDAEQPVDYLSLPPAALPVNVVPVIVNEVARPRVAVLVDEDVVERVVDEALRVRVVLGLVSVVSRSAWGTGSRP